MWERPGHVLLQAPRALSPLLPWCPQQIGRARALLACSSTPKRRQPVPSLGRAWLCPQAARALGNLRLTFLGSRLSWNRADGFSRKTGECWGKDDLHTSCSLCGFHWPSRKMCTVSSPCLAHRCRGACGCTSRERPQTVVVVCLVHASA